MLSCDTKAIKTYTVLALDIITKDNSKFIKPACKTILSSYQIRGVIKVLLTCTTMKICKVLVNYTAGIPKTKIKIRFALLYRNQVRQTTKLKSE